MKNSLWIKTLFRSPVRTLVTWVLLMSASFQFTLSLADYLSTRQGLEDAKKGMKGTLALEHAPGLDPTAPGISLGTCMFLMTDPTAPGTGSERYRYELYHPQSITDEDLEQFAALPGLAGIEVRSMAAGVSDYLRSDGQSDNFLYENRLILEGTIIARSPADKALDRVFPGQGSDCDRDSSCILTLDNIRVIGGDENALPLDMEGGNELLVFTISEEHRDEASFWSYSLFSYVFQNRLYAEDVAELEPGRRYVFAVRVDRSFHDIHYPRLVLADDTLLGWVPYFKEITDLPEDYLEGDSFAPLRELIQVTNDDWHTLDVVYTGDMSVIRRVVDLRLVPAEGRFLGQEDEGKPLCVVNADFAVSNGLSIGDTLKLKLGDYAVEQHVGLGAVASTRGRYASNWTQHEFTIVGTWRDVNQGKYLTEDNNWAYSDATVFIPSSFLPEGMKETVHSPGEITLLIDADKMVSFVQNQLPEINNKGWITYWNDRGWPQIEEELKLVVQAAMYKLLAFTVATLLVIALTVFLFINRRSRDYAILRALGMDRRSSGRSLLIPLLCLTTAAVLPGVAAGFIWCSMGGMWSSLITLVGIPVLIVLPILAGLLLVQHMGTKQPLSLLQSRRQK